MRKFQKILITGISGSGGSYLAEHILSKKLKSTKIFGLMRTSNKFNTKKKVTDSNHYIQDSEKYLSSIKIKKNEILTMKVISYHGKCYI